MSPVRLRMVVTLAVAGLGAASWALVPRGSAPVQPPAAVAAARPSLEARYRTASHSIAAGDTAGSVLRELDARSADMLLAAAGGRLDRLSIGDRIHIDWRLGDKAPWRLRLEHGDAMVTHLERAGDRWHAEQLPVPYRLEDGVQTLVVEEGSSLWGAAQKYGLDEGQIGALATIYEYDVDFNTEIKPGATIRAVTERRVADDGSASFGTIRAAEFVNGSKIYTAIRYTDKDGRVGWYAPDGRGRRKKFLRSPLAFSRVTSGFTMARWHPVLKAARPHFGVDFGCPVGTPVRAVADGVVEAAGMYGGHGNYVGLDHDGPYATSYSHLSRVLVKRGKRVRQGELIGYSGNTGLSTGPHLHYQFTVSGKFVNPMTIELPSSGGPDTIDMADFSRARDAVMPLLEASRKATPAPVAGAPAPEAVPAEGAGAEAASAEAPARDADDAPKSPPPQASGR